jgi:hypothetical protein
MRSQCPVHSVQREKVKRNRTKAPRKGTKVTRQEPDGEEMAVTEIKMIDVAPEAAAGDRLRLRHLIVSRLETIRLVEDGTMIDVKGLRVDEKEIV